MRRLSFILPLLVATMVFSCIKVEETSIQQSKDLPKYPETIVRLSTHNYMPSLNGLEISDTDEGPTRGAEIISETPATTGFGKIIIARSDETFVMENVQRYIFPGSILDGPSVPDMTYRSIPAQTQPITVSVSFPATVVSRTITNPSLSKTRQFIMDLMQEEGIGQQTAAVSFDITRFTSYDELKIAFGANKNINALFHSSSSSSNSTNKFISKRTGMYMRFVQKYFTIDMDVPGNDFVIGDIAAEYSPVYVSSVTYGRMGIFTIETEEQFEAAQTITENLVKRIFSKKYKYYTNKEKNFFDNAEVKVYVVGGKGDAGVKTILGIDQFIEWVSTGGEFSRETPGVPIYNSFAYLTDHSPYKVKFKIDVMNDPIYARIEYRNLQEASGGIYDGKGTIQTGDVYLAFYADARASNRTIPPKYINFEIDKFCSARVDYQNPYLIPGTRLNRYKTNRWYKNYLFDKTVHNIATGGVEILIAKNIVLSGWFYGKGPRGTELERVFNYQLKSSNFYRKLSTQGIINSYWKGNFNNTVKANRELGTIKNDPFSGSINIKKSFWIGSGLRLVKKPEGTFTPTFYYKKPLPKD